MRRIASATPENSLFNLYKTYLVFGGLKTEFGHFFCCDARVYISKFG